MFFMVRRRGEPERNEFVVIRITKVNPHSADARLLEYDKEGFIHISELNRGWIRDIRNHVRVGDLKVAKILRADSRGISLSIKRVDRKQEMNKLKEYKMEVRAEKFLEIAAKKLGKTMEQAYEEVGFDLQDSFGSIYAAFHAAVTKPQQLEERNVPEEWRGAIKDVAEKNIELKEFVFQANLYIKTYKPNGINIIKDMLRSIQGKNIEIKYIAAPKYLVSYKTRNAKRGEREFGSLLENIKSKDAEVKVETIKR